jgi:hypothetical protein
LPGCLVSLLVLCFLHCIADAEANTHTRCVRTYRIDSKTSGKTGLPLPAAGRPPASLITLTGACACNASKGGGQVAKWELRWWKVGGPFYAGRDAEYMDWNRQALVLLGWSIARNLRPNLNTEHHMHASSDTCTATSYYMKL